MTNTTNNPEPGTVVVPTKTIMEEGNTVSTTWVEKYRLDQCLDLLEELERFLEGMVPTHQHTRHYPYLDMNIERIRAHLRAHRPQPTIEVHP